MRTNRKPTTEKTHEGAVSKKINHELQLRRSIMSCMLWEKEFYEDGETITTRIKNLVPLVSPEKVFLMAIEARNNMKLRHVPLLLVREMARHEKHKRFVKNTLKEIIQRPDELCEFVSLYWQEKKVPLSAQIKKGLALAFKKFNEYQLAKYNRDNAIKLRDVLFLCHAKPIDKKQDQLWKRLINNELNIPDTWEVELSAGKDKKETFERLIKENKIGSLALLRNLRGMLQSGVSSIVIRNAIADMKVEKVLPFRFISAARYAPQFEDVLENSMMKCLNANSDKHMLLGKTILIIDISGSMNSELSEKSEMTRMESAFALSILAREICEDVRIYATAGSDYSKVHKTSIVAPRHGFALRDAIKGQCSILGGGGIFLKQCLDYIYEKEKDAQRVIVFTDEQDCDHKCNPSTANLFGVNNYIINIASNKNGIGYGKWIHIDGFSESVINYILSYENNPCKSASNEL